MCVESRRALSYPRAQEKDLEPETRRRTDEANVAAVDSDGDAGGLPQFDPTWFASQVFWLAISFTLLYLVFARKTLPNISSAIDRRRQQIESDVETTETLTKEAEDVLEAYEARLKESQAAARLIITEMEQSLKKTAESSHDKFREKTDKTIAKTEKAIEDAKAKALKDVEGVAVEVAAATAKKLIDTDVDAKNIKSIVSSITKQSSASSPKKKTTKKAA